MSRGAHPEYRRVCATHTQNLDFSYKEIPVLDGQTDIAFIKKNLSDKTAAIILQNPNFFGCVEDLSGLAAECQRNGALFILAVDPISLGLLASPGELGVSVCVGEGQSLGTDMSFGGPTLGFLACQDAYIRRMPGRLIGQTKDTQGRRGFVLTLQTREQHIRREKATSNICSNEALVALRAAIYLAAMGKEGIKETANLCLQKSHYAFAEIEKKTRFKAAFKSPFFKEFTLKSPFPAARVREHLASRGILGGTDLGASYPESKDHLLFCVTEKRTRAEIDALVKALGEL
jgi:glycine dehydrogenase subunit 1